MGVNTTADILNTVDILNTEDNMVEAILAEDITIIITMATVTPPIPL